VSLQLGGAEREGCEQGQKKAGCLEMLISSSQISVGYCLREVIAAPLGKEASVSHSRGWPRDDDALLSLVISAEQVASHLLGFVYSAGGRGNLLCVDGLKSVRLLCAELMDVGKETLCTSSAQGAPTQVHKCPSRQEASV